jgi:hypothetical protein
MAFYKYGLLLSFSFPEQLLSVHVRHELKPNFQQFGCFFND